MICACINFVNKLVIHNVSDLYQNWLHIKSNYILLNKMTNTSCNAPCPMENNDYYDATRNKYLKFYIPMTFNEEQ